jgi:hypothetical protein
MKKSHVMLLISGALLIGAAQIFMSNTANILVNILMVAVPGAILLRLLRGRLSRQAILPILFGIASAIVGLIFGTLLVGPMCGALSVPVFGGMLAGVAFVLLFVTLWFWRQ